MIKLLTVDDEIDVCDFIKDFFSQRGYKVFTAASGKDGLAVVEKERPRIVFLDICMADMSGLDVLQKIKEIDPSIKVIMISVADDKITQSKAKQLGADEFISKPFSKRYLEDVVIEKVIEMAGILSKEHAKNG
jgi:DNA-binding response OmpR family regulator